VGVKVLPGVMGVSVNVGDGLVVVAVGVLLTDGVADGLVGEGLAGVVAKGLGDVEAGGSLGLIGAEIFGEGLVL
jgi:hypothetical protein